MPKFQLLNLLPSGASRPISDLAIPGKPIELFEDVEDATKWADENPSHFNHGTFTVISVFTITPKEEKVGEREQEEAAGA